MNMNIIFLDLEHVWQSFLPLTYTRPISEIRVGILTISNKWKIYFDSTVSWITMDYLANKFSSVIKQDNILINSQVLPNEDLYELINNLKNNETLYKDDLFIAARISDSTLNDISITNIFERISLLSKTIINIEINIISNTHDVFSNNGLEIKRDFELITKNNKSILIDDSNIKIGTHPIFIESGAQVNCATLNATEGPIYIAKNATVMEGSLIRGPFSLGEGATVKMGAKIYKDTSIGPYCKVGGELSNVVMFGYSNKGHDGFLGNAVIGEWCNIGADTNNSNLKNNYSEVKLWSYVKNGFAKTGLQFCGLIMGDHSKCGINVMFNTGTVIGVSANIFGAGYQKNFIPSFSWGGPNNYITYKLGKVLDVAKIVMQRRNIDLTESDEGILASVFELSGKYRK